ncbi:CdaR family transcriptional regulator [Bacillus sp. V5-8f]|uniref:PucR family transcriptional regulator n=1 Tax=Bacillus sp. V5-8f TaxID=2053044 RepID=UPI0015E13EAD|nr:helix-turn-helix domain-containing protein [Bacillus sp. V5-8f]
MLKNLLNKFPNAVLHKGDCSNPGLYIWFKDHTETILGIPKRDISQEEIQLLKVLYPGESINERNISFSNKQWSDYLYEDNIQLPITSWEQVRFTQFTISGEDFPYKEFEEAFLSFVPEDSLMVWDNDLNGTLIEGLSHDNPGLDEWIPAISTLESDFYVKIKIFAGEFHPVDIRLRSHFTMERNCFTHSRLHLPDAKASSLPEVFPFLFMKGISLDYKEWYKEQLLGETMEDQELIQTVKLYIEHNSNASSASKALYIHRNSLQYRIDKFIEKTGLDIRSFRHALTTYLIILLRK